MYLADVKFKIQKTVCFQLLLTTDEISNNNIIDILFLLSGFIRSMSDLYLFNNNL